MFGSLLFLFFLSRRLFGKRYLLLIVRILLLFFYLLFWGFLFRFIFFLLLIFGIFLGVLVFFLFRIVFHYLLRLFISFFWFHFLVLLDLFTFCCGLRFFYSFHFTLFSLFFLLDLFLHWWTHFVRVRINFIWWMLANIINTNIIWLFSYCSTFTSFVKLWLSVSLAVTVLEIRVLNHLQCLAWQTEPCRWVTRIWVYIRIYNCVVFESKSD